MLFLMADVVFRLLAVRRSHGEHPVAALPIELAEAGAKRFDEFRRFSLCLLDELDGRVLFAHVEEDMDVIVDAADDRPGGIHFTNGSCQKGMNSRANLVVQKRLAIL